MIEWPLLFVSGVLGSAHCLGMCGPFAIMIGGGDVTWQMNLVRQICYSAGRIFTYAVLGAAAAFVGLEIARMSAAWTNVPAILAIVAGAILLVQGVYAAGVLRVRGVAAAAAGCPGASALRALLGARGLGDVFLAGLFTGFLPCGLLYGMLALAASTHEIGRGIGTMVVFGMGTVPAMVAAGLGGSLLGVAARRHLHVIAAWCLVGAGLVSIARGAGFVSFGGAEPAGCLLCRPR